MVDLKRIIAKGIRIIFNPAALTNCQVDSKAKICSGTQMNNSSIKKYSYCGHNCFILDCEIDAFVSIADNCRLGGATHPIERVSSSPVFHEGKNILKKNFINFDMVEGKEIKIHSDVWIGAGVIILSGVTIGVGSVIGAGSVVTHDVPPYEIWAGNPAKKIRDRFQQNIKIKLLETKWWEWDDEKITKYSYLFDRPLDFVEMVEENRNENTNDNICL